MSGNQKNLDNHSNQLNKNNNEFYGSRGMSGGRPGDWSSSNYGSSKNASGQKELNNHANQMNPNNKEFGHSRQAGSKK